MARPARDRRREARRARYLTRPLLLLLAAGAVACAALEDPPGGPPDFTPPVLLTTEPDSGAQFTDRNRPVRFAFNEIISEQGLMDLVTVSPRHKRLSVRWDRSSVTVRPRDGWRADAVYVVRLAPGLRDLRGNRLTTGATIVFTTGADFPTTALRGTMVNWEVGQRVAGALIEAIRPSDSLTHIATSDSSGQFLMPYLAPGDWIVVGTVDQDRNGRRGLREAFDSTFITLGPTDTIDVAFWAFQRDTVGPPLRELRRTDSLTIRLTFGAPLDTVSPRLDAVRAFLLPDTVEVAVDSVFSDLLWATRRVVAEPDSAAPAVRPAVPDTTAPPPDSLLLSRPRLSTTWWIRLVAPLIPGARYLIEATASNPVGATTTTRSVLVLPDAPPPVDNDR
ncbi:MAG: Ig-like domain-containing protein [Gemmatimonadales bacterium]